jgi:N-dimethylarginine dimethylaminohydrolase
MQRSIRELENAQIHISQFAERLSRECVSIQTIQTAKALHDSVLLQDKLCSPQPEEHGLRSL